MYIVLIRISVGAIFLSEGMQKFLFAAELGAGRFQKIGIAFSEITGPLVGATEITCSIFVLLGFKLKYAVLPLILIMCVAITTTKLVTIPEAGFWTVAHGARTDFAMLMSGLFLFLSGSGNYSLDEKLKKQ